jgi:CheY-like chemotaxis protein
MVIKLLAVEDQKRNKDAITEALEVPISPEDQRTYGIDEIKVTYARSKQEAIDYLMEAVKKGQPYNVVLLDIMIPETTPEGPVNAQEKNGIDVLKRSAKY